MAAKQRQGLPANPNKEFHLVEGRADVNLPWEDVWLGVYPGNHKFESA